jgi:aryl-alcohol dehydrogenase-like predicted oxidoreductase
MTAFAPRMLGRTGLQVGPLGLGATYGIADRDLEWALDHGCNYLYWGSMRRRGFGRPLAEACRTRRDRVVLVIQSYARVGLALGLSLESALRRLGTDHADVLLLGWWSDTPWQTVLEAAQRLREQGKTRFLALSTHQRTHAGRLVADATGAIDIVHVRYNAAHRGAEREVFPHRAPAGPGIVAFTATRWGKLLEPPVDGQRAPTAGDCYRFVLSNPAVDVCLAGPRNGDDVRAALGALERGPMDEAELSWMRQVGDRVHSMLMRA